MLTTTVSATRSREWLPARETLVQFLLITAQLALLFVALRLFEIEPSSGLPRLLPLVFAGFLIHAVLPMRGRLPFFLALSFAAIITVLGIRPGALVVTLGLVLFGICHLPVAFFMRVLLLILIGGVLAALRASWLPLPPSLEAWLAGPAFPKLVLPALAAMFMFRLLIYMYDLRQVERARAVGRPLPSSAKASLWSRLSYFFLLPNVCFLLFPVIDYGTYQRTYYDSKPVKIYQRGVQWIALGLVYLLAYRVVYHYVAPAAEEVNGLFGVVRFTTASYLVYTRVVGQFHVVIGILCLFGFNLPPAFRYFLVASGFTDYWRRARIEWKDFMSKLFYYPTLVPLQRRFGATLGLIAATLSVFVATTILHSYQWFWLRGDWRLATSDVVFWTIIGTGVLVNSLLDARPGTTVRPKQGFAIAPAILHASKVVALFVFTCVMWSYWSSPSFGVWLSYMTAARDSNFSAYALLAAALLAMVAAGVLAQFIAASPAPKPVTAPRPARWQWQPAAVMAVALALVLVRAPATYATLGLPISQTVSTLGTERLNAVDQERVDRGYYEVLLDEPRSTIASLVQASPSARPADDVATRTDDAAMETEKGGPVVPSTPTPVAAVSATAVEAADGKARVEPSPLAVGGTAKRGSELPASPGNAPVAAESNSYRALPSPSGDALTKSSAPPVLIDSAKPQATQLTHPGAGPPIFGRRRSWPHERGTRDMLLWENSPNFTGDYKGALIKTNQWGMRDREYSLARPPRTYRMALLGTSMTLGPGVPMEQTLEWVLEDRLNREGPGVPNRRYEILNFSVVGHGLLQYVATMDQKVLPFTPDAILVPILAIDAPRMRDFLAYLVKGNVAVPYPYVAEKLKESGATAEMMPPELRRRLAPLASDIIRWSYQHMMEVGRERGIKVIGVVLLEPRAELPERDQVFAETIRAAADSGMPLLDLRDVYAGKAFGQFRLNDEAGDTHWSALGHQLIGNRIYELLRTNDAQALKLGFPVRN